MLKVLEIEKLYMSLFWELCSFCEGSTSWPLYSESSESCCHFHWDCRKRLRMELRGPASSPRLPQPSRRLVMLARSVCAALLFGTAGPAIVLVKPYWILCG